VRSKRWQLLSNALRSPLNATLRSHENPMGQPAHTRPPKPPDIEAEVTLLATERVGESTRWTLQSHRKGHSGEVLLSRPPPHLFRLRPARGPSGSGRWSLWALQYKAGVLYQFVTEG
jgi:hypothetical protein